MKKVLGRSHQLYALGAMIFLGMYPTSVFAGPKEDCELVVRSLGFATDDYAFKQGGIFTSDQHIFGSLSCYVDHEGKFESLYRGDTAIAEDGYFGISVLATRDAAIADAESADEQAAKKRDDAITMARGVYDAESEEIAQELSTKLTNLRMASDPFNLSAGAETPSQVSENLAFSETESAPQQEVPNLPETGDRLVIEPQRSPEVVSQSNDFREMWVSAERLNIRSCPNEKCGRTGWALSGHKITIYEEESGWGRISEPVDAFCVSGFSDQIDDGDRRCVPENGISNNKIARWVSLRHLSPTSPLPVADPNGCSTGFLSGSDNYETYAEAFCVASKTLIADGQCTEDEFRQIGGWVASTVHPMGTFFTYCGEMTLSNKIYLEAKTGRIWR